MGTCPKGNLSGGNLSGIHIRKCTFLTRHIPQPCARRAHRNPPTDIHSRNVGSLYPIPIYLYYKISVEFIYWYWIYSANIWGMYVIWRVSVRPSSAGVGNISGQECTFSYMYSCIGYKLPTFGEYMLVGGFLCALRAQGWVICLVRNVHFLISSCPGGTCPKWNLSGGNLSGIHIICI